jgi:putative SOS response-associated peptidase YedK
MCARFNLTANPADVAAVLGIADPAILPLQTEPRDHYPKYDVLAATQDDGKRTPHLWKWGLVPFWSNDDEPRHGSQCARSDSIATKPSYRKAFKQRCLIPATCFWEWHTAEDGTKTPFRFHRADGQPFLIAAVWDCWRDTLFTTAIVTTDPNATMRPIHNRMPCVMDSEMVAAWLSPATPAAKLLELVIPAPANVLIATEEPRPPKAAKSPRKKSSPPKLADW